MGELCIEKNAVQTEARLSLPSLAQIPLTCNYIWSYIRIVSRLQCQRNGILEADAGTGGAQAVQTRRNGGLARLTLRCA